LTISAFVVHCATKKLKENVSVADRSATCFWQFSYWLIGNANEVSLEINFVLPI